MKQTRRRRSRTKRTKKIIYNMLVLVMVLLILILSSFLLFQTRSIQVTGTQYSMESETLKWMNRDKYAVNSLYIWFRYNNRSSDLPVAIESVKVKLKSPWAVELAVTEKKMYGYIDYNDSLLYFDRQGIASLVFSDLIPGVPRVEDLQVVYENIKMNQVLPVADETIFQKIEKISGILEQFKLTPDCVACPQGDINLYFGGVTVQLGTKNFEDKLAQVPPILEKLTEQYPGQRGTLHLENYVITDKAIRFVPETAPETEVETVPEIEG